MWVFLSGLALPLVGNAGMARFLGMDVPSIGEGAQSGTSSLLQWVSVCTSGGMAWVALAGDGQVVSVVDVEQGDFAPPSPVSQDMAMGHCLYCFLHDDEFIPDARAVWQVLVVLLPWQDESGLVYPPAPVQVFADSWSHRPLQPRAPPSSILS